MSVIAVKNYLANILKLSQTTTGAPINALNIPLTLVAAAETPAGFVFKKTVEDPPEYLDYKALALIQDITERDKNLSIGRLRPTYSNPDGPADTQVPISNYLVPPDPVDFRGAERQILYTLEIVLVLRDTDKTQGGKNIDALAEGIKRTILYLPYPVPLTDQLTGEGLVLNWNAKEIITQRRRSTRQDPNDAVRRFEKRILLSNFEVNYFG